MSVPTSWAQRNPELPTQPVHRTRAKLTDAQKATQKISKALNQQKDADLAADLTRYTTECEEEVANLAEKHSCKPERITRLLNTSSTFKPRRKPNLHNAILHQKAVDANQGVAVGEKLSLRELQELCQDENQPELADEEKKALIKTLEEHRQLKNTGMRISNRAASQDVHSVMENIYAELDNLAARTGIYAITLVTRGHVADPVRAGWSATGDGDAFIREVLKMDPWDLTRLFEMWACNRQKNAMERETLAGLRAECAALIARSLITITRQQKATMNYVNFEDAIVGRYKVKLVGWTFKQFVSPAEMNIVHDVRALRDALKNGACHWIQLSPQDFKDHVAAVDERRQQGEVVGKKRKERSDKGVTRTSKRRAVTDENEPPRTSRPRRRKTTSKSQTLAKSIPPKSKEFVDGEDDEDSATEDVITVA